MSLPGIAVGAVNAAAHLAMTSTAASRGAVAGYPAADWIDAHASHDFSPCQDRPAMAVRGIVIGVAISIPLWTLFAAAAYVMI